MGVIIPFIELIAGALVILGLRTREALISLGFVLAIVTFGHLLISEIGPMIIAQALKTSF